VSNARSQPVDAIKAAATRPEPRFQIKDYMLLLKPRVMSLVVFTAIVGMVLAPASIGPLTGLAAILCIAMGAGASGAINMWYDRDIDCDMARTMNRPVPAGRIHPKAALAYGVTLAVGSVAAMASLVNILSAGLLALTIVYYVFLYTMWLKRRTPQNIVIGGAAGALPPLIGWASASGDVGLGAICMFAIIFLWTPPHSWALALFRRGDYANAGVPMMPVVAGEQSTRTQMLVYTLILVPVTLSPVLVGMSGAFYGAVAAILGGLFLRHAYKVWRDPDPAVARSMFLFSILYLFLIFGAMLADRAVGAILTDNALGGLL